MQAKQHPMIMKKPTGCRIGTLNVNGLGAESKQQVVLDKMFNDYCDVIILTDTRLNKTDFENSRILYHLESFITNPIVKNNNRRQTKSRGVAVIINPNSEAKVKINPRKHRRKSSYIDPNTPQNNRYKPQRCIQPQ